MPHHPRTHRRLSLSLLAATGCLASANAVAQEDQERSPYYIGVSQSFTHDSNVFRTRDNEVSETISSTGVLVGIDQQFGRQRVFADALAQVNRYRNADQLNNKSYALTAGLDWETVEFLSGALRYSTRNGLTDFGTTGGASIVSDQVTDEFSATVRYGMTSYLGFDAGYGYRSLEYKNPALSNRNYKQDSVNAGLRWIVGAKLTLGLGARSTKGETPEYAATPPRADELKRRDVDLTATWIPGGFSTFNARISRTRETHTLAPNAELSETTGALTWDYRPTGRLSFNTSLTRDTGTETTFLGTAPAGTASLPVDNNRLSTSLSLETRYTLTGKTSLSGAIRQRDGTSSTAQDDSVRAYSLGLSYTPTRTVTLNCSVMREDRSIAGTTAYSATLTGCTGELSLR
jgi:hypothetical protein